MNKIYANMSSIWGGALADQLRDLYIGRFTRLPGDSLVIGIDFGTTYSGVAWSTLHDFQNGSINRITRWPGQGGERGKTPTQIYYDGGKIYWGYDVPDDADPLRWFKLLLLKEEDMDPKLRRSEYLLRAQNMVEGLQPKKTPVDVISDYLKAIWEHALTCITKERSETIVDGLQFHVVLTVPAIWKSYACQGMRDAVEKAGILKRRDAGPTTLIFAPEPEAAALATFADKGLHPILKPGEVHVICDAGGGTVDLISYEVSSVAPTNLSEAVEGAGGLCGGIFVDQQFESSCKVRLGRKWHRLNPIDVRTLMEREWEFGVKPQFSLKDKKDTWKVSIPATAFDTPASRTDMSREPVLDDAILLFKSQHVKTLFDSQFGEIKNLVRNQVASARSRGQTVRSIILVGGMGGSPYLYEVLSDEYKRQGISILQADGEKPWTAICRGAVCKGFLESAPATPGRPHPVDIISKVSRLNLGLSYRSKYREGEHPESSKTWDSDYEEYYAEDLMKWYIKRGEDVTKKTGTHEDFFRSVTPTFDGNFNVIFYQCEDRDPPVTETSSVKPLCSIKCRTTKRYKDLNDLFTSKGAKLKNRRGLDFTVEMTPSGSSVQFAISIDGQRLGSQDVDIEFDT